MLHHKGSVDLLASIHDIQAKLSECYNTLLWAVQIARRECWNHVNFEGDSKLCIDAVLDRSGSSVWAIKHLVFDICLTAMSFLSCSFVWVNRSCNNVAHIAAKFTIESYVFCFFSSGNLPPCLAAACREYSPLLSLCFLANILQIIKKKTKQKKFLFHTWFENTQQYVQTLIHMS